MCIVPNKCKVDKSASQRTYGAWLLHFVQLSMFYVSYIILNSLLNIRNYLNWKKPQIKKYINLLDKLLKCTSDHQ